MEILLVEDGLTDARITILALRRSQVHHRLTLVRTIAEAIAFFRRDGVFARAPRPDLMMLDMMLPDGSGIAVLEAIDELQTDEFRTTTVVLTSSNDESLRQKCAEFKVNDYISKPVKEDEFMRVVREHKKLMIHTTPLLSGS